MNSLPPCGGGLGWGGREEPRHLYHKLARELRKNLTDTERWLWGRLRGKQFGDFKFRKQAPIGRFVVDFVCFERKLVVELDGDQHARIVEEDNSRTQWLNSQGFRVIRFWNHEVFEDVDMVMETIWLGLQTPPRLSLPHEENPPTFPSHTRGEGKNSVSSHGLCRRSRAECGRRLEAGLLAAAFGDYTQLALERAPSRSQTASPTRPEIPSPLVGEG
jgi:very-short-patch-repair endonuclease